MKNLIRLNSKGISVLFLIIALLIMVSVGYAISYLIPPKQKSIKFPIYSTQAYYIAQSGVEYGIRYSSDRGWRGATDTGVYDLTRLNGVGVNQRNLGNGKFTINYTAATNTLTSTGEVTNSSEKRIVTVSNFTPFLRLVFDSASPAPCRTVPTPPSVPPPTNRRARFYIQNMRGTDVILIIFSATWTGGGNLTSIYMDQGGGWVQKYSGNYASGTLPPFNFNMGGNSQTITPNQVIPVLIFWDFNLGGASNIIITFYTPLGDPYVFNLDPEGDGLPRC